MKTFIVFAFFLAAATASGLGGVGLGGIGLSHIGSAQVLSNVRTIQPVAHNIITPVVTPQVRNVVTPVVSRVVSPVVLNSRVLTSVPVIRSSVVKQIRPIGLSHRHILGGW